MKHERPDWDTYFMTTCDVIGTRSTCDRGRTGSIIVLENHILSTGYAGAPRGIASCDDVGHEMHKVTHLDGTVTEHCIRTAHAEQNAIIQAARVGVALNGSTIYVKMTPCYICAKMIINVGIVRVIAGKDYHASQRSKELFEEAGVTLVILDSEVTKY